MKVKKKSFRDYSYVDYLGQENVTEETNAMNQCNTEALKSQPDTMSCRKSHCRGLAVCIKRTAPDMENQLGASAYADCSDKFIMKLTFAKHYENVLFSDARDRISGLTHVRQVP